MKDFFRKLFGAPAEPLPLPEASPPEPEVAAKPKKVRKKKPVEAAKPEPTAKEAATLAGQPYVNITRVEVNPDNINDGAVELDWNDKFLANLIRAGYKIREDDTDSEIVERWFIQICRNIALEMYEQQQADPRNRDVRPIQTRNLGGGYTEVS